MGEGFQHQFLRNGHTQMIADESHNQGVVPKAVGNTRFYRALGDEVLDIIIASGGLDDKRILEKIGQGHALLPGHCLLYTSDAADEL